LPETLHYSRPSYCPTIFQIVRPAPRIHSASVEDVPPEQKMRASNQVIHPGRLSPVHSLSRRFAVSRNRLVSVLVDPERFVKQLSPAFVVGAISLPS
jgi:hypothetical protein